MAVDSIDLNGTDTSDYSGFDAEIHIRRAFDLLCRGIIEARCFDETGKAHVGYFDDPEKFVKAALGQDRLRRTCYATLNPPDSALLARHNNKIGRGSATADKNITWYRNLLIDFDPVRLADIPSTDAEKKAAYDKLLEVRRYLLERGWPEMVIADSGNGYHLVARVNLDVSDRPLVKGALEALDFLFSDERVKIDASVDNPARVTKLYGTTPRKGDGTEERPHRPSMLLDIPGVLQPVSRELLVDLAGEKPEPPKVERRKVKLGERKPLDVKDFIARHNIEVLREGGWNGPGEWADSTKWLVVCPWNGHEDNACHIIQNPEGVISARCKHDSCQGKGWQDFRLHYEPDAYDNRGSRANVNPLSGIISARDLMRKKFTPKEYVIEGTVPVGVGLVPGKPKIGKSWLVLNESIAVAAGTKALGTLNVKKGRVLLLALEDNERRLQERLRSALAGEEVPEALDIVTEWPRIGEGFEEALKAYLDEHPDTVYVAIDTLKKIRPRVKANKGIYDADYEALEPLLPMAAKYNIAIQVVHHLNKMVDPDDPLDSVSGSTGLTGGVDNIRILNRERGQADAFMYVTGRDVEEQKLALRFDDFSTSWVLQGEAAEFQMSEARKTIYDALKSEGKPLTPNSIAEKIGKSPGAVRERLRHMLNDGQVSVNGNNQYYLPTTTHDDDDGHDGRDGHDAHDAAPTVTASRGDTGDHDAKNTMICREKTSAVTGVMGITGDEELIAELNEIFLCSYDADVWFPRYQEFRERHGGANVDRWAKIIEERMVPA